MNAPVAILLLLKRASRGRFVFLILIIICGSFPMVPIISSGHASLVLPWCIAGFVAALASGLAYSHVNNRFCALNNLVRENDIVFWIQTPHSLEGKTIGIMKKQLVLHLHFKDGDRVELTVQTGEYQEIINWLISKNAKAFTAEIFG